MSRVIHMQMLHGTARVRRSNGSDAQDDGRDARDARIWLWPLALEMSRTSCSCGPCCKDLFLQNLNLIPPENTLGFSTYSTDTVMRVAAVIFFGPALAVEDKVCGCSARRGMRIVQVRRLPAVMTCPAEASKMWRWRLETSCSLLARS